ncbi:hypothetical protein [Pandoravirus japonicus]|uniref:Uncharacterized protein n=1 Tax=Pandoravirus japonicus TaxID=2823154 RepID=A0A811BR43_9VIRU|nr:hypothetical protein [Pandoravirus japonicus]
MPAALVRRFLSMCFSFFFPSLCASPLHWAKKRTKRWRGHKKQFLFFFRWHGLSCPHGRQVGAGGRVRTKTQKYPKKKKRNRSRL